MSKLAKGTLAYPAVLGAALVVGAALVGRPAATPETAASASAPSAAALAAEPERAAPPAPAPSAAAPSPPAAPLPAYVRIDPAGLSACAGGMVLVYAIYCPFVGHRCVRWADEAKDACAAYAAEALCEGGLQRRRFCIDVFEYPNLEGVRPVASVDFVEADRACAIEDKRLCAAEEWELACEGAGMWPYPYGLERDATACNIDRVDGERAVAGMPALGEAGERADGRVASGEFARCISPFGARDMTGNVEEWVVNEAGRRDAPPYRSALKGGAWGPGRARCRPLTTAYDERYASSRTGFRCCADAKGDRPARILESERPAPAKRRLEGTER